MRDRLSASEAALLRVFASLGVADGVPVPESQLAYHWGRASGVAGERELKQALLALLARGYVQPGPESLGYLGWQLTEAGFNALSELDTL